VPAISAINVSELEGAGRLDAEYYRPELRRLAARLSFTSVHLRIISDWITQGPNPCFTEAGVPCLNGRNVAAGRLSMDDPNYVSREEFEALSRFQLRVGDILVTLKGLGSIGQTALVSNPIQAIFSHDLGLIRLDQSSGFLPEYVYAYLSCLTGRTLLERGTTGATGQMTLTTSYLARMPIPAVELPTQRRIAELISGSEAEHERARSLYLKGEQVLLEDLGWRKLDLSQPKCWLVPLSAAVHRLDPDHFQPKYQKLVAHLEGKKSFLLGEIAPHPKRGVQPDYVAEGSVVVVNSQHIGPYFLDVDGTERTDKTFWEKKKRARLQKNDLLLYSTGAYVGRTNVWFEDRPAIASNHVTIIRPAPPCDPHYLAAFLNSPAGMMQADEWATGSAQREVYAESVSRFVVHLAPRRVQDNVAELLQLSYLAYRKAKALLEQAKAGVEAIAKEEEAKGARPANEEEREQRKTWMALKKALEDNRLSDGKLFLP
jgi:restriction endonuclease S subunit